MDPETQRLFTIALIGLLLFFPIFNQVAQTAVDALTEADHKAQFEEFFKDWDSVPPDRKLEYWDGRNAPPGDWNGDRDDDPTTRPPDGGAGAGPGGEDPGGNGEDPNETEEPRFTYQEEVLWAFNKDNNGAGSDSQDLKENDYHWVNITWAYENFNGEADFQLTVGDEEKWRIQEGDGDAPALLESEEEQVRSLKDVGVVPMTIDWEYFPVAAPSEFYVVITGTYPVPVDD